MYCPDCGKTIGRFRTSSDSSEMELSTLKCPDSQVKHVLDQPVPRPDKPLGPKAWKNKKSRRPVLVDV